MANNLFKSKNYRIIAHQWMRLIVILKNLIKYQLTESDKFSYCAFKQEFMQLV